jgi:RNA polymerase-binding transcription factor DksA
MDSDEARKRLEAEKARVAALISEQRTDVEEENVSEDAELSPYDAADSGSDLEVELAEIEAAIVRIEDGTYGIDEVTGAPIDPARLEAVPAARTNVDTPPPA